MEEEEQFCQNNTNVARNIFQSSHSWNLLRSTRDRHYVLYTLGVKFYLGYFTTGMEIFQILEICPTSPGYPWLTETVLLLLIQFSIYDINNIWKQSQFLSSHLNKFRCNVMWRIPMVTDNCKVSWRKIICKERSQESLKLNA